MQVNTRNLMYMLFCCGYVNCAFTASTPIQVKQVVIGPQSGDSPTNFSLNINLVNGGASIANWQFGFYMPRNFRQTSQSNRHLSMKVCESNTSHCAALYYQKALFSGLDLSTVFTTIVAPLNSFPLVKNKAYTRSLLHNSSRSPQNYSALPQSMFVVTDSAVYNLTTTQGTYHTLGFNAEEAREKTQQRIQQNWDNSSKLYSELGVIPQPQKYIIGSESGNFDLRHKLLIHDLSNNTEEQTKLWQQALNDDLDLSSSLDKQNENTGISLQTVRTDQISDPEGYSLEITPIKIVVKAATPAGFFYALQTLRQLWFQQTSLAPGQINDAPRFHYRGILLDVARHYLSVEQIKNFIDIMAAAKLNTLHLHLSDDEAFRLELDDFPELKKLGSVRGYGLMNGPMAFPQKNLSKTTQDEKIAKADSNYGSSYSKSDIHDLIRYANLRQISIIPEIDIPGHSRALMKAMPNSFYESEDHSEYPGYGDNSIPVCAYGSNTELGQKFTTNLSKILYATAQLFTNQNTFYTINNELSIGGDEVFNGTWDKAPSCQLEPWKNMSYQEKEHYFLDSLSQDPLINKLRLSGWHEFVIDKNGTLNQTQGVKPNEVGHVWVWGKSSEAKSKAIRLSNDDYPVVLDYSDYLYFDMTYTANFSEPGFYWASKFHDTYATLSSAKAASLTQSETRKPQNIIGLEGAIWTDVIPSYSQLLYMAIPKIAGLSEAAWSSADFTSSGGHPDWQSLALRLGCGKSGFLAYLNKRYNVIYRGYPHGIKLEAPQLCPK